MPPRYARDLAFAHHDGFGGVARSAARAIATAVPGRGRRAVDLGCGSGILARELGRRGWEVLGFDASPAMVALARRTAPRAHIARASAYGADIPACDVVVATGEVFNYVDEAGDAPPHEVVFRRARAALAKGGVFVFDAIVTGRPLLTRRGFMEGSGWAVLTDVTEDPEARVLRRCITTFRAESGRYRRTKEVHVQRIFDRSALLALLRRVGFAVRTTPTYGDGALPPRRTVFWAR